MEHPKEQKAGNIEGKGSRPVLRKIALAVFLLFVLIVVSLGAAIAYNNVALWNDASFARRLDSAISRAEGWVEVHRMTILKESNVALLTMLRECDDVNPSPLFRGIVDTFLSVPTRHPSSCWRRETDPNWPIDEFEFRRFIRNENVDNKWALYAIAPNEAGVNPEELGLFDAERWHRRQLTHQVFALTMLRDRHGSNERLDKLLAHLCGRINSDITFCVPVVDIYIQRAAFVLRAGFPQEIRRRWVERIIANQQSDGGWNDRWLCFTTVRRKPIFDIAETPSDQHATVQAILALYLVKYRYPEQFGLK